MGRRARPVASAVLILLAAPPLGFAALLAWFALGFGPFSLGYVPLSAADLLACYGFGGVQSAIAALVVARQITRHGWVNLWGWLGLTLVLAALPAAVLYLTVDQNASAGLISFSIHDAARYFTAASFSASLILRALLIGLGWMRRPAGLALDVS